MERLDNEVHLWQVDVAELANVLEPARVSLLNDEERARAERYRHVGARQMFLAARWLVRNTLSRYAEVEPADWRFRANAHGRPEIDDPRFETLRFNLSHSHGVLLLGVSHERDIGVDVERIDASRDLIGLARHSFAAGEIEQVASATEEVRADRFYAIWTLKEAYIKARGMGLAFPLDRFCLTLDAEPARFEVDAELDPAPADWRLHHWRLLPAHHAALFVRRPPGSEVKVLLRSALDAEGTGLEL